jgi:hypothetical protein
MIDVSVEALPLARTWVHGIQSGRRINVGDRMQMHDLVHRQTPLVSDPSRVSALWRAFEDCVNLGIAQLLASPVHYTRAAFKFPPRRHGSLS